MDNARRAWELPAMRTGLAVLCAVGMFAAAFVLLDAIDPTYLDGFGL